MKIFIEIWNLSIFSGERLTPDFGKENPNNSKQDKIIGYS